MLGFETVSIFPCINLGSTIIKLERNNKYVT